MAHILFRVSVAHEAFRSPRDYLRKVGPCHVLLSRYTDTRTVALRTAHAVRALHAKRLKP